MDPACAGRQRFRRLPARRAVERFGHLGRDPLLSRYRYSLWANDDYRLSSKVSLSLGLRYEYTSPLNEKYDRLANLALSDNFTTATV